VSPDGGWAAPVAGPDGASPAGTPAGLKVAVAVVSLMLASAAAIGVGVVIGHGRQPGMQVAAGGSIELTSMPTWMASHYRFAAMHTHAYEHVPCFCGCDATLDHRSLLDCFVRPDGGWERHASGCAVCTEESEMIRAGLARGSPMRQIRSEIVDTYTMDA
jgi:hypothetical protein